MAEPTFLAPPRFTLDRREAEVVRKVINHLLSTNTSGPLMGDCRALEIRLHNFLASTKGA